MNAQATWNEKDTTTISPVSSQEKFWKDYEVYKFPYIANLLEGAPRRFLVEKYEKLEEEVHQKVKNNIKILIDRIMQAGTDSDKENAIICKSYEIKKGLMENNLGYEGLKFNLSTMGIAMRKSLICKN